MTKFSAISLYFTKIYVTWSFAKACQSNTAKSAIFFSKSAPDIIHHGESREKSVVMLGHFQPWAELSQQKRITNKKYLVAELRKFVL